MEITTIIGSSIIIQGNEVEKRIDENGDVYINGTNTKLGTITDEQLAQIDSFKALMQTIDGTFKKPLTLRNIQYIRKSGAFTILDGQGRITPYPEDKMGQYAELIAEFKQILEELVPEWQFVEWQKPSDTDDANWVILDVTNKFDVLAMQPEKIQKFIEIGEMCKWCVNDVW